MPRDYEEEYSRRQYLAFQLGYESDYQRRQIKGAETPEELRAALEPLLRQRANEGDTQSMGLIYRDLYDSWDMPGGFELSDIWDDIGISDIMAAG
jgi:hypothetical protein